MNSEYWNFKKYSAGKERMGVCERRARRKILRKLKEDGHFTELCEVELNASRRIRIPQFEILRSAVKCEINDIIAM